ncbi:MAG TPA: hypothetical protein VFO65_13235 [Acidimicrobiales bacterium]|nr:hypothetical protein [Acidimicrobiales bacterium]
MADREDIDAGTEGQNPVTGYSDAEQHRVPPGQGNNAPLASETGGVPEMSIFDGAGTESVVVATTDENGKVREGTGPDRDSALKDARNPKTIIGDAFNPQSSGH